MMGLGDALLTSVGRECSMAILACVFGEEERGGKGSTVPRIVLHRASFCSNLHEGVYISSNSI